MWRQEPVDSRQYRFGFLIGAIDDAPTDFALPSELASFQCGLFLPRDDSGFWSRYPARVILLCHDKILVVAHPASREAQLRISLGDLEAVESGRILLLGWISFYWKSSEALLTYNRRTKEPVDRFLSTLRGQLLATRLRAQRQPSLCLGDELDLKFRSALTEELDGETVDVQFFRRPREHRRRVFGLLRQHYYPGDLLVATNRRLLWITDRYRGHCERYGYIARYATLRDVTDCRLQADAGQAELIVILRSGRRRVIPARADFDAARMSAGVFQ